MPKLVADFNCIKSYIKICLSFILEMIYEIKLYVKSKAFRYITFGYAKPMIIESILN